MKTWKTLLCAFLLCTACGYRQLPEELTFMGKGYTLGTKGRYEFVDRNLYFLPGENIAEHTTTVDISRMLDKKRPPADLHRMLVAGLRREVKTVIHEQEEAFNWCVVYMETPGNYSVSYHVVGLYRHGAWCTDFGRKLTQQNANASACNDAPEIWRELTSLGERTVR